jgi:hypothetical protein
MPLKDNMEDKRVWKKEYTVVLVLNTLYVIIFYLVMTAYT